MRFEFTVAVEAERTGGPFGTRDDISEEIAAALEAADYGSWDAGDTQYETVDFDVQEVPR